MIEFSKVGGGQPPSHDFFKNTPIKADAFHGVPPFKNKAAHWKIKPPSRKWHLQKKPPKLETVINTCVSRIKQQWQKMVEIPYKFSQLEH